LLPGLSFRSAVIHQDHPDGFINEFNTTDPVSVDIIPVCLNIILPACKIPHKIAQVHKTGLIPEEETKVLREVGHTIVSLSSP